MNCMFHGNFKADWVVLPPGSNVAARAKAMSFWDRIADRINNQFLLALLGRILQPRVIDCFA